MQQCFKNFVNIGPQDGHEQMLGGSHIRPGRRVRIALVPRARTLRKSESAAQPRQGRLDIIGNRIVAAYHRAGVNREIAFSSQSVGRAVPRIADTLEFVAAISTGATGTGTRAAVAAASSAASSRMVDFKISTSASSAVSRAANSLSIFAITPSRCQVEAAGRLGSRPLPGQEKQ